MIDLSKSLPTQCTTDPSVADVLTEVLQRGRAAEVAELESYDVRHPEEAIRRKQCELESATDAKQAASLRQQIVELASPVRAPLAEMAQREVTSLKVAFLHGLIGLADACLSVLTANQIAAFEVERKWLASYGLPHQQTLLSSRYAEAIRFVQGQRDSLANLHTLAPLPGSQAPILAWLGAKI